MTPRPKPKRSTAFGRPAASRQMPWASPYRSSASSGGGSGGLLLMKGTASSGGLLLDLGLNNAYACDLIHVGMLDSGFKAWFMWVDDESWTYTGSVMMNIGCWMGYPAAISSMACWKIHHLVRWFSQLKTSIYIGFSSLPCLFPAGYVSGLCNNTNHDHY